MVKITNSLLAIAALCASLGIYILWYLLSTVLNFKFISSVRVGADVVIHRPVPNPISGVTQIVSASVVGASAIDVQADGATRYVVTEVESFAALASGGHTSTVVSTPITAICESLNVVLSVIPHRRNSVTLAEGASVYSASAPRATTTAGVAVSGGEEVKCTGTGNRGKVNCVQEDIASAQGAATTLVTSFVATTSPIFTISGTQAVPKATSTNSASHIMVSLTSTSILGLMGTAYVIFYGIY